MFYLYYIYIIFFFPSAGAWICLSKLKIIIIYSNLHIYLEI